MAIWPFAIGIPTVTVPMGLLENIYMPVGLTFAGRAYAITSFWRWLLPLK